MTPLSVVAYGGGVNSTALLLGMKDKNIIPDLILFADTGGERPETYNHIKQVNLWLEKVGFPLIVTVTQVKRDGSPNYLEDLCLEKQMLPSIAYGYKTCSQKHKIAPQDKYVNNWHPAQQAWINKQKVIKFIGYDYDEDHRVKDYQDDKYEFRYPLVDWKWGRKECLERIKKSDIPVPIKSSCFFCPNSKPREIIELKNTHPDLFNRAIAIEKNANLISIKGLGRTFSWSQLVNFNDAQIPLFLAEKEMPCGCYDGSDD